MSTPKKTYEAAANQRVRFITGPNAEDYFEAWYDGEVFVVRGGTTFRIEPSYDNLIRLRRRD